jgi:predicted nucleic acid-binding protein
VKATILDTGPLVALFDKNDHDHAPVLNWFAKKSSASRLLSTEAVVTETTHMLDFHIGVQTAFLDWVRSTVQIVPVDTAAYEYIAQWMRGYAKVPMDFADATVLWLYGQTPDTEILTLDQRGFGVFRLPGQGRKMPKVIGL